MPPDIAQLGRWLRSWTQPSGAIHGFHNHTVWGDNPYYYQDMTAGHTTFAAPTMLGLAHALAQRPDPRGQELIERMIRFQATSFQADDQFDHIGFQIGDTCKLGLVHNAVPAAAMSGAAMILGDRLPAEVHSLIDAAVRRNKSACDRLSGPGASMGSCANQEYIRVWSLILHMRAFNHREWDDRVQRDIDLLIKHFHVPGVPDEQCQGTLRALGGKDDLEPAEYYGLMVLPLVDAARRFGREDYLDIALAICRHVARSAWRDQRGALRFHRIFHRVAGRWHRLNEPMLIGGMGMTMAGMQALVRARPDAELESFLNEIDRTYAAYQNPAGFFLGATGWQDMRDLIPSTAWQSHDFFHLAVRHGADETFWDRLFANEQRTAVVLGPTTLWIEGPTHWSVRGYYWASSQDLLGRKDRERFYVDIPAWIGSGRETPDEMRMPGEPQFLQTNDAIHRLDAGGELLITNHSGKPLA